MTNLKRIRRTIRRPIEIGGVHFFRWLIPLLPRQTLVGLTSFIGRIAWHLPLKDKRVGLKNLDAVFGDTKTAAEKRAILTTSFSTFILTVFDLIWFSKDTQTRINSYINFDQEKSSPLLKKKAQICITAHFGNWEIMGQAAALRGIDLASIAAPVKNQDINRILIQCREETGQTIIPQKGALRTLIARLRKEEKVAFVLDQNTPQKEGGISTKFLGLPTSVSPAPAALAYRTGSEIVFGFCIPQPQGKYLVYTPKALQPPPFDKTADADQVARELTQKIQDQISKEIRKHPEYWLWSYKHWRRKAGETYPDDYPNYE